MANKFPREFLLAELRRVGRLVGGIPSMADFGKQSKLAAESLVKRFGGWRKALAEAGFDPSYLFTSLIFSGI
ncbi:MAG: homing endonuclease associated repeat-containing protein [Thermoanaerobaculia bacterium]